eukprot:TRINITY_DN3760_c0_g1_i1.p1 TRINITY_DN3760_c0_g1~~TRINITY_DN3760_c0_g1_i1.p1  ORF type:complete len:267 (-),score=89.89 TRINITY_DN3760_c0_g1_i1:55-855(-)
MCIRDRVSTQSTGLFLILLEMGPERTKGVSRNPTIKSWVQRYGRARALHRTGRYKLKVANFKQTPKAALEIKAKVKKFGKKNEDRVIQPKGPKYYPTEPVRKLLKNNHRNKAPKFRKSLVPGAILILLAGKYKGSRVVLLKTLPSGLLAVTGPYNVNGVPLRRVNPAYVIATTTRVDLTGFTAADKVDDAYFQKPQTKKEKKPEAQFFEKDKTKKSPKKLNPEKVATQKAVDSELLKVIQKTPLLNKYLSSKFGLSNGQAPHDLKF